MKTNTIINNKDKWQGHPDVALFNSGVGLNYLFVVYRESDHHKTNENTSIKVVSGLLTDKGVTYGDPVTLFESGSEGRYNCPRLSVIGDELFCVVDYIKNTDENFVTAENTLDSTEIHITSTLNGSLWKNPIILPGVTGIVPDRLQRHNGNYVLATHMARPSPSKHLHGRLVQDIWISPSGDPRFDHWQKYLVAGDMNLNLCEASIFKINRFHLGCIMRENSQKGLPAYHCISRDNGKTWNKHRETRLFGAHRPVMGVLGSGNFLVTYRDQSSRFSFKCWARNTFAAIIYPDSKGYPDYNQMNILPLDHDRSKKPDGGYTGWVELPDKSIYIVNYITDDSAKPYIKSYLLSEKDFCDESLEGDFF